MLPGYQTQSYLSLHGPVPFLCLLENLRFITVFTRGRHCLYPEPNQSNPHPLSLYSIFQVHPRLSLPSCFFLSGFPSKTLYTFSVSPMYATSPNHHTHLNLNHPNSILWRIQIMKLLSVQNFLASCYFLPLRSKYSPQYLIHKLQVS